MREPWRQRLSEYRRPDARIGVAQVAGTLAVAAFLWWAALEAERTSYWLALAVCVLLAVVHVRIFILQHDCMHGSFFASRPANVAMGYALSLLTLTPHHQWRASHLRHHAHSGNLDRRSPSEDIYTMTAAEYRAAPATARAAYRAFRHPAVMFGVLPFLVFTVEHRFARGSPVRSREFASVAFTNVAIAAALYAIHVTLGLPRFLSLYLPMAAMASSFGLWLFYVQHNFRGGFWTRGESWGVLEAALRGTSFYDLPRPLAWLTANIGYHHVHHLDPLIPNYRLAQCHRENEFLRGAPRLTLGASLRDTPLDFWDEDRGRMAKFSELR